MSILKNDSMENIDNIVYNYFNTNTNIEIKNSINSNLTLKEARDKFEKEYLMSQLKKYDGNVSKTAQSVGMERSALHRKLTNLNIKY